jgi:hypothetical protein
MYFGKYSPNTMLDSSTYCFSRFVFFKKRVVLYKEAVCRSRATQKDRLKSLNVLYTVMPEALKIIMPESKIDAHP